MPHIYSLSEVIPTKHEAEFIATAKRSYDKAKASKSPADFDGWINSKKIFFQCAPRGIAYSVSQKSHDQYTKLCLEKGWKKPASPAIFGLRFFILAVAIGWDDLVQELKKTLKYWGYSASDIEHYAKNAWLLPDNIKKIQQLLDEVQDSAKFTLIEAVEKQKNLNPKLFTKDESLKENVRKKMLEIVEEFTNNLQEQNIEIKIDDILLVGSNANYNYTKDSDIDLHIVANTKNMKYSTDIADALYSAYRTLFNKNLEINIYNIPLELYVETENTPRNSNGVYSVKKDKWEKKPVLEDIPEYDKDALEKLVTKWETKCKDLLAKVDADKLKDEKSVVKLIEEIYEKLRKTGVAKSEYAIENLAFKELRNKGYLDKLKLSKHELISKRLSLQETLDRRTRAEAYTSIAQAAFGNPPIIQDNGYFFIYNLKDNDVNRIARNLEQLDIIAEVWVAESGKYDFSRMPMTGLPPKYYNIRGKLTDDII